MSSSLLVVAVVGLGVTAAATPLARRLARATGFLDHPGGRKRHREATPYLGGLAILAGVVVALASRWVPAAGAGVVVLGAGALAALGLWDDRRGVSLGAELGVQTAVAAVTVAVGFSAHVTGWVPLDAAITVVWLVGITNALNLLDNIDGLAAGTALAAAAGLLVVAVHADQPAVAGLGGAVAGACAGFLFYNLRDASIFMGDAGSLVLGYLLAVGALALEPAASRPVSLVVPLLLLALPLTDTTMVVVGRLAHGRPVMQGGRDHLSHRLIARGLAPLRAVATLLGAQAVAVVTGVLAGTEAIPPAAALGLTFLALAAVVGPTVRSRVYGHRPVASPVRGE